MQLLIICALKDCFIAQQMSLVFITSKLQALEKFLETSVHTVHLDILYDISNICTFLFSYNAKNTIHEISHILGVNLSQSYFCAYLD